MISALKVSLQVAHVFDGGDMLMWDRFTTVPFYSMASWLRAPGSGRAAQSMVSKRLIRCLAVVFVEVSTSLIYFPLQAPRPGICQSPDVGEAMYKGSSVESG